MPNLAANNPATPQPAPPETASPPGEAPLPTSAHPGWMHALPPLLVSGLLVTRAALVAALRPYVPQLTDLLALDGGERFLLRLGAAPPEATRDQGPPAFAPGEQAQPDHPLQDVQGAF